MAEKLASPDRALATLAARQHGVVTTQQLRELGLSHDAIRGRVRTGRLHRVHQGVYAVGHWALSHPGRWLAAVFACGEGTALSHRDAAALWRLLEPRACAPHVTVRGHGGRARRDGIRLHRSATLERTAVTRRLAIPVTTVPRTLADLRGQIPERTRRRAIRQAEVLGLPTGIEAGAPTRSELEDRFLRLCRQHGIAAPEVNARVGRREVDFLWREPCLIVETDGYRFHRGQLAFEDDHARDLDLREAGFSPLRLTYRQVRDEPGRVAARIRRELEQAPASRGASTRGLEPRSDEPRS